MKCGLMLKQTSELCICDLVAISSSKCVTTVLEMKASPTQQKGTEKLGIFDIATVPIATH